MTSSPWHSLAKETPPRWSTAFAQTGTPRRLTIAVVNCMPDAALRATERQLCSLFGAASSGLVVQLKFYTLPGIPRSAAMQAHIDAFYEDINDLDDVPPDGPFMTGTEPSAGSLKEEAFWPAMAHAINLCHDNGIPAIWSCLAAHAAVLEIDGISRVRLPTKVSGVFKCRMESGKHQIFHRLPKRWVVPHSRLNGLARRDLERSGYDIVSASSEVGIDIFIKRCECIQVFLQGHPEYNPGTLAGEYRRDVLRAFNGQLAQMPSVPYGLRGQKNRIAARVLGRAVSQRDEMAMRISLEQIIMALSPRKTWIANARQLFENWFTYIDARKQLSDHAKPASRAASPRPSFTSSLSLAQEA